MIRLNNCQGALAPGKVAGSHGSPPSRSRVLGVGRAALGALVLAGCGSELQMAPVSGTVTMQGKPVGNVLIVFNPQPAPGAINAPTRPAMATADAQGHYDLSTHVKGDGAVVGKHKVSVAGASGEAPPPGRLPRDYVLEVKPEANQFDLELTPGN